MKPPSMATAVTNGIPRTGGVADSGRAGMRSLRHIGIDAMDDDGPDPDHDIDAGGDPDGGMHAEKREDDRRACEAGGAGAERVDEIEGADGVADLAGRFREI